MFAVVPGIGKKPMNDTACSTPLAALPPPLPPPPPPQPVRATAASTAIPTRSTAGLSLNARDICSFLQPDDVPARARDSFSERRPDRSVRKSNARAAERCAELKSRERRVRLRSTDSAAPAARRGLRQKPDA